MDSLTISLENRTISADHRKSLFYCEGLEKTLSAYETF